METFIFTLAATVASLAGGFAAFKSRSKINLTLSLTAGIILGLVAFDLLPEIFEIAVKNNQIDATWPMVTFIAGFLAFHVVEKFVLVHDSVESKYGPHSHPVAGLAGAIALSAHSLLDGLSIGLAFQLNSSIGTAVAIAVIGHRFADGFNTSNVMLRHKNSLRAAKIMLLVASAMPVIGGLLANLFSLSQGVLALYLGFFAGFLLYIAAGDILPQAHSKGSSRLAIGLSILGVAFMFLITRIAY